MAFGDLVLFGVQQAVAVELWRSDGTAQGTRRAKEITTGSPRGFLRVFGAAGGLAYLAASDGVHGLEPWRSDGTEAGTFLLRDISPSLDGSSPSGFFPRRERGPVYFAAQEGLQRRLWATDGTPRGTAPVAAIGLGWPVAAAGGVLFLIGSDEAAGQELWASDGTAAGTRRLKDIRPGPDSSLSSGFSALGDVVLFAADDGVHGAELWRSDGTEQGTRLVRDLSPGPTGSSPEGLTRVGGLVYFHLAFQAGCGLWMSDGTELGTRPVPGTEALCVQTPVVASRHRLFFSAGQQRVDIELWALPTR